MNFTISNPLTLTYSVDKCTHERFNGTHTETFDLSGLTSEDITQYIAQTLVIKRQGMCRSKSNVDENGVVKLSLGEWKVPAPGKRISTTPMQKATDLLDKLSPEARRAFLLDLLAKQDAEMEAAEAN
jgi:hypothetical protein